MQLKSWPDHVIVQTQGQMRSAEDEETGKWVEWQRSQIGMTAISRTSAQSSYSCSRLERRRCWAWLHFCSPRLVR